MIILMIVILLGGCDTESSTPPGQEAGIKGDSVPFPWDGTQLKVMSKLTGKVESLPLVDLGAGQAQAHLTLAAGDALMFKYATGRLFPLGS